MCEDLVEPILVPDESRVTVDAVYGREEDTRLMRKARENGAPPSSLAGGCCCIKTYRRGGSGREPNVRAMGDVIS